MGRGVGRQVVRVRLYGSGEDGQDEPDTCLDGRGVVGAGDDSQRCEPLAPVAVVQQLEQHLEELQKQVSANRGDIDALQVTTEETVERTDSVERHVTEDRGRIDALDRRVDVDHELLLELRADGLGQAQVAAHLQVALRSSRLIGAAIGIVMASCKVSEDVAFEMLRKASQDSNTKLRVVADEVLHTGAIPQLDAGTTAGATAVHRT
ncbi:MAG: hypothetical protein JWP82_2447 [Humibacillus sp.]|nr:hypothetical protein [Humibacillus sp.]